MINKKIKLNKVKILETINKAREYNGQQQCIGTNIKLHDMRDKLLRLSDGEVDFYFERNNSNIRLGAYRITLKCTDEVEFFLNNDF